jgi:hypothetical protein
MNLEIVGQTGEATAAVGRRILLQVIGMQRSGNHAIIGWLSSLFERPAHLNNLPHDFFCRTETVTGNPALAKADCSILSFEDTKRPDARALLDIELLDRARLPGFDWSISSGIPTTSGPAARRPRRPAS